MREHLHREDFWRRAAAKPAIHFVGAVIWACGLAVPAVIDPAGGKEFAAKQVATGSNPALVPQVGGADVLTLRLAPSTNENNKLQFLSVTLFPGRGMNVFQITGNVPGKGEAQLLRSPSIEDAAKQLNGAGPDEFGNLNDSFGGAFLIPFTSRVGGTLSAAGKVVDATWQGRTIRLPQDFLGKYAVHGLINQGKAQDLHTTGIAGGRQVTGVIHAGDFEGHWLSATDLLFTIALTRSAVDVTVTAKNVGKEPEPMAIGWHPYLAIPSGDRAQARVHIPAATRAEVDNVDGRTTGKLLEVKGTPYDFSSTDGAWLADPKSNYGIRVEGLSDRINTVHLYSPKNDTFAAIEEQCNFQDPFGEEWKGMDTGLVTLRPGESTRWRVRLELFAP